MRALISWIGFTDLRAAVRDQPDLEPGPILRLLRREHFDAVHLLNDVPPGSTERGCASLEEYIDWVCRQAGITRGMVRVHPASEPLRNQYGPTYQFTCDTLRDVSRSLSPDTAVAMLLSPGTPAAGVAMILGAQTLFDGPVELFNTWKDEQRGWGVECVELPFSLTVDVFIPKLLRQWQERVRSEGVHDAFETIVGKSGAIRSAMEVAQRVAPFEGVAVLIRGETGTGKECFAKAIHLAGRSSRNESNRPPFIAVNCAAIPSELLESELFGHVRGAFTGASTDRVGKVQQADGGTLFLDEIGDMALPLQAKLLRVIQDHEFSPVGSEKTETARFRLISATHRDLRKLIAEGSFREDLYYRSCQFEIVLPPLRERGKEDVELLARHLLANFNEQYGTSKEFSSEALVTLSCRSWRGNVRELQNVVSRLAIMAGDRIERTDVEMFALPDIVGWPSSLQELSPDQFATELAAVVDELLCRFHDPVRWPLETEESRDLVEQVLLPLVFGRAIQLTGGNRSAAGAMFQKGPIDLAKEAHQRRLSRYEADIRPCIEESRVSRLRTRDS